MNSFSIPVSDEHKKFLSECIYLGYKDMAERVEQDELSIQNAMYQFAWNYIDKNLKTGKSDLVIRNLPRGGWKVILIVDPVTRFCFGIMSEDRFDQVKKQTQGRRKKCKEHYTDVMITFKNFVNQHVKRAQISMFDFISFDDWNSKIELLQTKVLQIIGMDIEQFVLVTFEREKTDVHLVKARILTEDLENVFEPEDWSQYIPVEYPKMITYPDEPVIEEQEERLVNISSQRKKAEK